LEAADVQTTLARREIWPDLTVGVQYAQRGSEMGTERMGSLMVGASVPIFARHRQLRMREEAAAMRQMAAADLRAMHADTRGRITETYADLVRARNLASLYRTTVIPQAQATVSSAHSAYRVGNVDFMTLLPTGAVRAPGRRGEGMGRSRDAHGTRALRCQRDQQRRG
jgi:outer membrane protein TolC